MEKYMPTQHQEQLEYELLTEFPKKFKVYLLNDDYTSMDFVIDILTNIFHKNQQEAQQIMLEVHNNQKGLCGVYTHEIAETKVAQVISQAKENSFPLKAIMEEE
jgi:ATP-dependent Clp protease adaptor protein ClpS